MVESDRQEHSSWQQNHTRLRIWGSGVRISSGAPIAYKTTNICGLCLPTCDYGCEGGFIGNNSDFAIVHLNMGDDRPQVGFAGFGVACVELFAHQAGEGIETVRV